MKPFHRLFILVRVWKMLIVRNCMSANLTKKVLTKTTRATDNGELLLLMTSLADIFFDVYNFLKNWNIGKNVNIHFHYPYIIILSSQLNWFQPKKEKKRRLCINYWIYLLMCLCSMIFLFSLSFRCWLKIKAVTFTCSFSFLQNFEMI
jgi:hypothetical protein